MQIQRNRKAIWLVSAALVVVAAIAWDWPAATPVVTPAVVPKADVWQGIKNIGVSLPTGDIRIPDADNDLEEVPEGMARVDDRGRLIADVQLHNAIDAYLLHADVPSRQVAADKLRAYLARKLPPSVTADARALVSRYLAYMDAHDTALERLRLSAPGKDGQAPQSLDQFAAWQEQRRILRQTMLGPDVYKQWYAAEDLRCAGLLAKPQAPDRAVGAGPAPSPVRGGDFSPLPADGPQWQDALDCATESSHSFALLETEGRQWTRHYARYRAALAQLHETNPARRAQQLADLRQQAFSTDAERERAAALNVQ